MLSLVSLMCSRSASGPMLGNRVFTNAATPAVNGDENDVPLADI